MALQPFGKIVALVRKPELIDTEIAVTGSGEVGREDTVSLATGHGRLRLLLYPMQYKELVTVRQSRGQ